MEDGVAPVCAEPEPISVSGHHKKPVSNNASPLFAMDAHSEVKTNEEAKPCDSRLGEAMTST
jgi:hypothetical protein